ncbi:MAG: DNA gyrase inhibitor YacG [Hyphomicrobiales bacterium]|nr:DNA gyrase inhibitor YacG [Hyphomicrobiales bacterium]
MSDQTPAARGRRCPICGKPTEERLRPFCSSRCADVDLSRWLHGVYAIPAEEDDDEAGEIEGGETK